VKLPHAPFRLSEDEIRKADTRAKNIRVPSGYGWKPSAFFGKRAYIKSHDWKQVGNFAERIIIIIIIYLPLTDMK